MTFKKHLCDGKTTTHDGQFSEYKPIDNYLDSLKSAVSMSGIKALLTCLNSTYLTYSPECEKYE